MAAQSASARLRRTFHYPSSSASSSDGDADSVMDEQEQESFIARLTAHNRARNAQFRQLLLAMPAISSIPYFLGLFRPATALVSLLALSSLGATAYLLWVLPVTETGIEVLDRAYPEHGQGPAPGRGAGRGGGKGSREDDDDESRNWSRARDMARDRRIQRERERNALLQGGGRPSPLLTHLPYLNVVLSMAVAVAGFLNHRMVGGYQGTVSGLAGLGNLPAIVNVVVLVAKVVMAGVDPERELNGLRYGYKGA